MAWGVVLGIAGVIWLAALSDGLVAALPIRNMCALWILHNKAEWYGWLALPRILSKHMCNVSRRKRKIGTFKR